MKRIKTSLLVRVLCPVWLSLTGIHGYADEHEQSEGSTPMASQAMPVDAANDEVASESVPATDQLPELPSKDAFNDILERPLFSETRRPDMSSNNEEMTSASELREQWKLTGVVMVGGEVKALLQERTGDKRMTLTPGMPLDASWMLEEIKPNSVIMGAGDEQVRLDLMEPRDTTPVSTAEQSGAESPDEEGGNAGVRPLDERTREATRRLQQDIQQSTEIKDE